MFTKLEALKQAKAALDAIAEERKKREKEKEQKDFFRELVSELKQGIDNQANLVKEQVRGAVGEIKIEVPKIEIPPIQIPEMKVPVVNIAPPVVNIASPDIPEVKIPTIKVPKPEVTVNVPEIKIPSIEIPEVKMPTEMEVRMSNVDSKNPLPVILTDPKGNYAHAGGSSGPRIVEKPRVATGVYNSILAATTATQIVPAQGDRKSIGLSHEATDTVYIGLDSNVTTSNGMPLLANQVLSFDDYLGAVFAIISNGATASTISVRYIEF